MHGLVLCDRDKDETNSHQARIAEFAFTTDLHLSVYDVVANDIDVAFAVASAVVNGASVTTFDSVMCYHLHFVSVAFGTFLQWCGRSKLMKGKALRKHSLHEKTAASVLLKLFISGNE